MGWARTSDANRCNFDASVVSLMYEHARISEANVCNLETSLLAFLLTCVYRSCAFRSPARSGLHAREPGRGPGASKNMLFTRENDVFSKKSFILPRV